MTKAQISAVLDRFPILNDHGMGLPRDLRRMSPADRGRLMRSERVTLLNREEECRFACEWLSDVKPIKTPNHSSYYLKHLVEETHGYLTNGAFIVAAIHCGFPIRINPDSINADFGVSKRSLAAKLKAERGIA